MTRNKCLRCGYEWSTKKEKVKCCPSCRNYRWNVAGRHFSQKKFLNKDNGNTISLDY